MENVIGLTSVFWIFANLFIGIGKADKTCNVSLEQVYKRRGYYSLKITLGKSNEFPNNKTFLQLCFSPSSTTSAAIRKIFSTENNCKGERNLAFYGIGRPMDITTGRLDGAYIKEMMEWDHTNLEIDKAKDMEISHIRMIEMTFWYSPVVAGNYKCVIFHVSPERVKEYIEIKAESIVPAMLNRTNKNVLLSVRHTLREFILGDYVYIVCDYKQDGDEGEETIKVEYADGMSVDYLMQAEVTPEGFELDFKRKAAVFQISSPIKRGISWYFLNPTMIVKCEKSIGKIKNVEEEKIRISFVPFDPIIYLRKRKGHFKRADTFSGVQVFKSGESVNEQQLTDRLKRNSLQVGDVLSCTFKADPKPAIKWSISENLKRYVHIQKGIEPIAMIDDEKSRRQNKLIKFHINCSATNNISDIQRTTTVTLQFYFRLEGLKKNKSITYESVALIALNFLAILSFYFWVSIVKDLRETRFVSPRFSKVPSYMISKSLDSSKKSTRVHPRWLSFKSVPDEDNSETRRRTSHSRERKNSDEFFL